MTSGYIPPKEFPEFDGPQQQKLRDEFSNVKTGMEGQTLYLTWKIWHEPPRRFFPGMELVADGTDWNPTGAGYGKYLRNEANTAWQFVG